MALNKAYNQYKENSIFTATPEELTLMLYNGLVKSIMQGQNSIEGNEIEKASNSLVRAQDILQYFRNTLDMRYDISEGLDALYEYMIRRLVDANMKKDQSIIDEILGMARELRDTWAQAMKLAKRIQKPQLVTQE